MNNSSPKGLEELLVKLGLFQDANITFDLKAINASTKISYTGFKIDILTLLVHGTRKLLKDLDFSLDRYIELLERLDNPNNDVKDKFVDDAINKLMNDILNTKK